MEDDRSDPFEPVAEGTPFNGMPRTTARHGGSVLMAAMIGIAEALGLDPEPTEIAQPAGPSAAPGLDLNFGDLPPLD